MENRVVCVSVKVHWTDSVRYQWRDMVNELVSVMVSVMMSVMMSVVVVMQEIDEMVSQAKQVQQQVWTASDDVTVVDDGPVEIRQLLKP